MKSLRSALVFCIAATLVGCAGTHGSSSLPAGENLNPLGASSSGLATTTNGTLTFQITIPTNGIDRSYVSPATKGMQLAWTGTATGQRVFNLTHTNTNCVKTTKRVCTFKISFVAGSYHATFTLYDQAPSGGQIPFNANLLSSASNVPFTITSGQTKTIAPILLGVPAKLSVGPMPVACAAFPATPFAVTAFDADSHKIAGAYATAITLSDGDTSGATTIATSGYDKPPTDTLISSFDKATIAWNGNAIPGGSATIGAQAGSASVYASSVFTPQVTGSTTFGYTGGYQYFTVPACATTVFVTAAGAQGGSVIGSTGGSGGLATGTIPTTPGETLVVVVGGAALGETSNSAGYNGGGIGGPCPQGPCDAGAGGGGATDVRQNGDSLYNRVAVGAGGGGAGATLASESNGGPGGGLIGGTGTALDSGCAGTPQGGGGGTQTSGGVGPGGTSSDGSFGSGGPGYASCVYTNYTPGGGGGGWYGGGGGYIDAGGGGGSSYVEPSASNVQLSTGVQTGNGYAEICWGYSNQMCGSSAKKLVAGARHAPARRSP
ncbi:MAG TPA: glycine-rich protein [Candidatus Baltobacteraceae bacterium]|jgi:hypothetical protein|nr:glycine-rich protein [Candidatus Baltobacteraceae bacterium]